MSDRSLSVANGWYNPAEKLSASSVCALELKDPSSNLDVPLRTVIVESV